MYSRRSDAAQQAAQSLLSSAHSSQRYGAITSSNHSAVPSNVSSLNNTIVDLRRTFSLLVTFDFILTFVLWIMAIKMNDGDFIFNWKNEFLNYSVKKSFFDFVICSFLRFTLLLFFYVFIKIINPSVIALTTLLTCVFVIVKACLYESNISTKSAIFYVIMIESFLISWIETWFLDFKMLPLENMIIFDTTCSILNSQMIIDQDPDEEFKTPSEGSDEEENDVKLNIQEMEYLKKSRNIWNTVVQIFLKNTGWLREGSEGSINVQSQVFQDIGKVFRLETVLEYSMTNVFQETNVKINEACQWNKTIIESRIIQLIDPSTDIVYHVTASAANGAVKSRDFVSVRHWRFIESSAILSVSTAVECPNMPPTKQYIRGETRLGAWMFESLGADKCRLKMLVATDIKGWIPQMVADQAISNVLIGGIHCLQLRLQQIYPLHHPNV